MPPKRIPAEVRKLAKQLAEPRPMRRGSVSERFMKCGQKGCRCRHDPQARHGPYFSLTRVEGGKTRSRYLSPEQAALAQQQVEAGQEFRKQVETYWQACEQWGDTQLGDSDAASQEGSQKGGLQKGIRSRDRH